MWDIIWSRSCMSSSYKGYYVITFLNVKFLKEILCDHVLVRQIPIMYVKFLCSQLDFPMGFLCIQKVLYCGFHCFIVRQNKSKQRIWNLTNMCPESLYICETEQIQNNEKSRNLYVSRKFPCTKSPNSWLSASSCAEVFLHELNQNFLLLQSYHLLVLCAFDWHA